MAIREGWKRLGVMGTVVAAIEGFNRAFDLLLYPVALVWLGTLRGGITMTLAALTMNYLVVIWYNQTQKDWFGIEWAKLANESKEKGLLAKVLGWALHRKKWLAFVLLSIYDPIYGFIVLRGRRSRGWTLSRADWFWFIVANLIGNLVWIATLTGAIETIKYFVHIF